MMPWAMRGFPPGGFPNPNPYPVYSPEMLQRLIPQYVLPVGSVLVFDCVLLVLCVCGVSPTTHHPSYTRLDVSYDEGGLTKAPTPYQRYQKRGLPRLDVGASVMPNRPTPYQLSELAAGSIMPGVEREYPATTQENSLLQTAQLGGRRLSALSKAHALVRLHHRIAHERSRLLHTQARLAAQRGGAEGPFSGLFSKLKSLKPKARAPMGQGAAAPMGSRPTPPQMLPDPSAAAVAMVAADVQKHSASDMASKYRFDHEQLFGPVPNSKQHPRAPMDPDKLKPLPMSNTGSGSDSVLAKVPKPLAPMVWQVPPDFAPWATAPPAVPGGNRKGDIEIKAQGAGNGPRRGPFDAVYDGSG